jgi:predicted nucleic acid-binding protein
VLYEVYKSLKQRLEKQTVARALAQMSERRTIPLDETLALTAAETSLTHSLPMADAIIYATAWQHEAKLVTSDAHFEGLPGVEYIAKEEGK